MRKHALFYSERCVHSKAALSMIQRLGLTGFFTFISVDTNRHSIPPVVTCVPTIVTDQRSVLVDEQLVAFIQAMAASSTLTRGAPSAALPEPQYEGDVSTMSLGEGTLFSENFSFIGDPEQCASGFCRGFVFVDEDVRIQHPVGDEEGAGRKRSEQVVSLDQLVSDRAKMIV